MPGPAPTFAEAWTQLGNVVKAVDELYKAGSENTPNFVDLENTLTQSLEGKYTKNIGQVWRDRFRGRVASVLDPANLRALFMPAILELADVVDAPEMKLGSGANVYTLMRRIREYMVANSQTLNSRGMTIPATPSSSSGTGNGTVRRITVDEDNSTLECLGADTKTFRCVKDAQSGARRHREVFELSTPPREEDYLYYSGGSIDTVELAAVDCKSSNLLQNPSFEQHDASADNTSPGSTTGITGWTIASAAANLKMRSAAGYTYRGYEGEPDTLWGIEFAASDTINQILRTTNPAINFQPGGVVVPWHLQIAWQRKASATGQIELFLGDQSTTVDISTGANDAWNILLVTLGTKSYYKTFNEADLDIKIAVTSLATGTVVIDDVLLAPFYPAGGGWWLPIGGSTPFLKGDLFTFADQDGGTRAKYSYWLTRAFVDPVNQEWTRVHGWFPTDNAGTETIADV